jgi:hypothetical protein
MRSGEDLRWGWSLSPQALPSASARRPRAPSSRRRPHCLIRAAPLLHDIHSGIFDDDVGIYVRRRHLLSLVRRCHLLVLVRVEVLVGDGELWPAVVGCGGTVFVVLVVAAAAATWWWRWWWPRPWRSGGGGPRRTASGSASWILTFFVVFKSLCRELYCSRYTCAEGDPLGSRHRALCRPSGVECSVPRVSSRHRLRREQRGLCREDLALGRGCESGSASGHLPGDGCVPAPSCCPVSPWVVFSPSSCDPPSSSCVLLHGTPRK